MRLIDADTLKKSFEEDGHLNGYIEEYIDEQPTIDSEPVRHGRWVKITQDGFWWYCCSECSEKPLWSDAYTRLHSQYCPNCGAKMDGGAEDASD